MRVRATVAAGGGGRAGRWLRRIPMAAGWRLREPLNWALDVWERRRHEWSPPPRWPVVFLIGAPRTGSTLLYQLLVAAFRVGYLANRHCRWYGAPSLLRAPEAPRDEATLFASEFGQTAGGESPSECGRFWYRFFPREPQYVKAGDVSAATGRQLAGVLGALERRQGRQLIFKNMNCALRLEVLGDLLPSAVFVEVVRSARWTAQSILLARQQIYGRMDRWWSLEPPGIDELRPLAAEVQVVEQIRRITGLIAQARARFGEARFVRIRYEELCADVPAMLGDLEQVLGAGSAGRSSWPLPQSFARTDRPRLADAMMGRLDEALARAGLDQ